MPITIKVYDSLEVNRCRVTLTSPGIFRTDFGQLFQGRRETRSVESTEVIELSYTWDGLTSTKGEAFDVWLPGGERRFTVYPESNYVSNGAPVNINVSVVNYKLGEPDRTNFNQLPYFEIRFPGKSVDNVIRVDLHWVNYWVTATILAPEEYTAASVPPQEWRETATYQKWKISVRTDTGIIPKGEKLSVEVLLDDPTQLPTPIRRLTGTGDYNQIQILGDGTDIKGRRGVMVTFDATTNNLIPGAVASSDVYIRKKSFADIVLLNRQAYMHFGEHSDKGIYTNTSEYLQVGNNGGKLNFTIYPDMDTDVITDVSATVTWKVMKSIPSGSWDSTVSLLIWVPDNSGTLHGTVVIMEKGQMIREVITKQYERSIFAAGPKTIIPVGDPTFNEAHVNFLPATPYVLASLPAGVPVVPLDSKDVYITSSVGEVVNGILISTAAINYDWNASNAYYVQGGKITVDQLVIRRDSITNQIMGIETYPRDMTVKIFTINNKLNHNLPYYYDLYLHVKSLDVPVGYTPFDYYVQAGSARMFSTSRLFTFKINYEVPVFTIPAVTTTIVNQSGIDLIYNHLTNKYFADGGRGLSTGLKTNIGNIYGIPLPVHIIYLRNLSINTQGQIFYVEVPDVFNMEEILPDGIVKPIVDLKILGGAADLVGKFITFKASIQVGVAPQDLVVYVSVVDDFTHAQLGVTSISIAKGVSFGTVVSKLDLRNVSYRVIVEFSPDNIDDSFVYGNSPTDFIIPSKASLIAM